MTEQTTTERTFFLPLSGLDATNYLVIASQVKLAAHVDVQEDKLRFVDVLRNIIALHKQYSRTEVTEDGSVQKSTNREIIERMDELLQSLKVEGLRLCFRMRSILNVDELVHLALTGAESIDNEGNSDEAQQKSDSNGYGAVVAFLIVPDNLPLEIADPCNGHAETRITKVPDWDELSNEWEES